MSEDMTEVVKYIAQREEQLSKYSDKLRQAVQRIFSIFGNPTECQICGYREDSEEHFEYTTYNEWGSYLFVNETAKNRLLQTGKYQEVEQLQGRWKTDDGKILIVKNKNIHQFMPKIRLSISFKMTLFTSHYEEPHGEYVEDEQWGLATKEGELLVMYISPNGYASFERPKDISRRVLKDMVRNRAIVQFLQKYREQLDKTTEEFKDVSEIAEKMANVLG